MEFHHHNNGQEFLEEIFLNSQTCFGMSDIDDHYNQNTIFSTPTTSTFLESSPLSITSQTSSSFEDFSLPFIFEPQTLNCSSFGENLISPFVDHHELLSASSSSYQTTPNNIKHESSSSMFDQDYYSMLSMLDDVHNNNINPFVNDHDVDNNIYNHHQAAVNNPEIMPDPQRVIMQPEIPSGNFNIGKNVKNPKLERQPSKNLMAERRRRKRLNDRLSMLRSIVPKISKMDRTSILGDTIDYMKELIEKINHMQEEMDISTNNHSSLINGKPKEIFIRNSPKFNVERRDTDTFVQVSCTSKPELLISTMTTLEALGLEINQCVISCFNDFMMHASCSEEMEQRVILNSEDIKQALFKNAGYGGKCL